MTSLHKLYTTQGQWDRPNVDTTTTNCAVKAALYLGRKNPWRHTGPRPVSDYQGALVIKDDDTNEYHAVFPGEKEEAVTVTA